MSAAVPAPAEGLIAPTLASPPTKIPWLGLLAVLLGTFISTLNGRLSTFGLADIRGALGAGVDEGAWITTARQALVAARDKTDSAYRIAHDEFAAGAVSNLDLLTTEQSLVSLDAAVAAADAALIQDQIAVFKALGGGWRDTSESR
jgi:hypothetical protein